MPVEVNLDKDLLIDALEIAASQRKRAAMKFKVGSAAHTELDTEGAKLEQAVTDLKTAPTPVEEHINKRK